MVLVEAKLWSGKSGVGEFDLLGRYLQILDDLEPILPAFRPLSSAASST